MLTKKKILKAIYDTTGYTVGLHYDAKEGYYFFMMMKDL